MIKKINVPDVWCVVCDMDGDFIPIITYNSGSVTNFIVYDNTPYGFKELIGFEYMKLANLESEDCTLSVSDA